MPYKFTVEKKGYNMQEVDLYVVEMERKLEQYRARESAITNAIVSAQETAGQIIKNAEVEAEEIVSDCEASLTDIKKMLESEKKALSEFCYEYDSIVRKYFSGSAEDITAPLKEKLLLLGQLLDEKAYHDKKNPDRKDNNDNFTFTDDNLPVEN